MASPNSSRKKSNARFMLFSTDFIFFCGKGYGRGNEGGSIWNKIPPKTNYVSIQDAQKKYKHDKGDFSQHPTPVHTQTHLCYLCTKKVECAQGKTRCQNHRHAGRINNNCQITPARLSAAVWATCRRTYKGRQSGAVSTSPA